MATTSLPRTELSTAPARHGRLRQLDSLRAFAIFGVLVEHWGGPLRYIVPIGAGKLGVSLFFTLSGFLITGILLKELKGERHWKRVLGAFYVRRFFRLLPAFYVTLLISAVLNIDEIRSSWFWHAGYLTNFYMASGGARTVFWTLAVEEQFYLLWPLALLLTPPRWWRGVAFGMILLGPLLKVGLFFAGSRLSFYLLPAQIEFLGAGCLLALLCFRDNRTNSLGWISDRNLQRFGIVAFTCLAIAVVDWLIHPRGITRALFLNLLCCVFFAWLVLKSARGWDGLVGKVLDMPVLQYIGVISYSIYLVHNWMPDFVEAVLGPLSKPVAAPIVAAGTFGFCALSWHYFERPLIAFGRKISDRIEGPKQAVLR